MAFHFGLPGAQAGFLGVDVFFVLSGFLITSLLLGRMREGRLDVLDFWTRRLRRLLPALLVVVGVMVAWGALVAPAVIRDGLRGDIEATLLYVANWHFVATSTYFANNGVPSPLEHMWSLAVEEQFYLVWPLVLLLIVLLVRDPRRRVVAVAVLAAVGLVASAVRLGLLWGSSGQDRAYLGTDSRIFEPLTGALLAALMASAAARRFAAGAHWGLLAAGWAGLTWGLATLGGPGGATRAYADGARVAVASETAAVISAVATRESGVTRVLALPAVAYLGRLSYAMYLWHWPLQVWTGRYGWWDLSGLGTPARASILTALTVALAALSYHLVEKPVRYGSLSRFLAPRRMVVAVPLALGALFAISSSVVVPRAGAALGRVTRTIVLVGDSVPQRLAPDLARAAARYGYVVVSATRGSCPATGVAVVGVTGKPWGAGDVCATDVPARQDAAIAQVPPRARDLVEPLRTRRPRRRSRTACPVRLTRLLEAAEASVRDPHTRADPRRRDRRRRPDRTFGPRDGDTLYTAAVRAVPPAADRRDRGPSHLERLPRLAPRRRGAVDQHRRPRLPRHGEPMQRPAARRNARPTDGTHYSAEAAGQSLRR